MENASKALLIAGAILIAILLIGIGMMVFGNIGGITAQSQQQMDSMEIQIFNSKFSSYAGNNVSGSNVKQLLNTIVAHNASTTDISLKLSLTMETTKINEDKVKDEVSKIKANNRYSVVFTPTSSGFYTTVTIKNVTQ